jgi:hypothetical protein
MRFEDLSGAVASVVISSLVTLINFIPSFIGGLVILIIGLVLAAVAYRAVYGILKTLQVEKFLARYGVTQIEGRDIEWGEMLAEVVRWAIIIVFLVPALQAWRLDAVNTVLNRIILYIPNVLVAVILAMVGLAIARISYKVSYNAAHTVGKHLAHTVGLVAQWSITVFVAFLVLHQLGVAQELLRILFSGLVAMIALAGGLAFGFGGQQTAKEILEAIVKKFEK